MSREITTIVPLYGSNRANARRVGELLGRRAWVGVPFLGGGTELRWIDCRAGVASDLNRHVLNLGRVIKDSAMRQAMVDWLANTPFHEGELAAVQGRLRGREAEWPAVMPVREDPISRGWAYDYFLACWMTRSASAGTGQELTGPLAVRWTSSGGDSAVRFRAAVDGLVAWGAVLARWSFVRMDGTEFVGRCKDDADHAVYADPPWPDGPGALYRHTMTPDQHEALAAALGAKVRAPVVVRIGDTATARRLYPEGPWAWERVTTRSQANTGVVEVLIHRNTGRGVTLP